ncbi:MAG: POLO box duplicated region [Cyanobacteriota bacterium]|nr:POLO box duplicated region [Cyanobacteriota bacterium]
MATMLTLLLTLLPARAAQWPDWQLPAPLRPAGNGDLVYPSWFAGSWQLRSHDPEGRETDLQAPVRFKAGDGSGVVGERAFNAAAVGKALLGPALLDVANDPANPNRQLGRLQGEQLLESTVVARASATQGDSFWADELSQQVLHQPGQPPRLSQVETLSRYERLSDGSIGGEQWQATYPAPGEGLRLRPLRSSHWQLRLEPVEPGSDRTS